MLIAEGAELEADASHVLRVLCHADCRRLAKLPVQRAIRPTKLGLIIEPPHSSLQCIAAAAAQPMIAEERHHRLGRLRRRKRSGDDPSGLGVVLSGRSTQNYFATSPDIGSNARNARCAGFQDGEWLRLG